MDIRHAAKFSMHNKKQIEVSQNCGCYYCLAVFDPQEIKEYTDGGDTVLCPYCNVDAVLPESLDFRINKDILERINKYWF